MEYNFELNKVLEEINKINAKTVLLQFPDGLKTEALSIANEIEEKGNVKVLIWADDCYGACDYPIIKTIDLLVQFGHSSPLIAKPLV
ncbi:diphthamide synthesis protein [Candidatus Woesearchaeota archaeon]|nr:diphthamide synthesis protein [Candidatus Woesearchaeota archaeon]